MFRVISRVSVASIFALGLSTKAHSQTAYTIPNGDFETSGNASTPANWVPVTGSFITSINGLGACPDFMAKMGCQYNGDGEVVTASMPLTNSSEELDGAAFSLAYCVGSNESDDTYTISVEQYDQTDTIISTYSISGDVPNPGECDGLQTPPVTGDMSPQATAIRIRLTATSYSGWDNIGPLDLTVGGSGSGGGDGELTPEEEEYIANAEAAIQDALDAISSFDCDDIPSVGNLSPSGGGFAILFKIFKTLAVSQLAALEQLENDIFQSCQAATQTAAQEGIFQAVAVPDAAPSIPVDDFASNPTHQDLREVADNSVGLYDVGSDSLVTAANKTNRLLIATAKLNAESWDRALGGQRVDYETERGAKINEADIVNGEPNLEFAEGNYGQTYGRASELSDVEPDYLKYANIEVAPEVTGSCLVNSADVMPTGDAGSFEQAFGLVKHNAAATISGSNIGTFLCDLIDQPDYSIQDICVGPTAGIAIPLIGASSVSVLPANGICVYGPSAPSYLTWLLDKMPFLLMFGAVAGSIRLFI